MSAMHGSDHTGALERAFAAYARKRTAGRSSKGGERTIGNQSLGMPRYFRVTDTSPLSAIDGLNVAEAIYHHGPPTDEILFGQQPA